MTAPPVVTYLPQGVAAPVTIVKAPTVLAYCGDPSRGGWYCTTHQVYMATNVTKNQHSASGVHNFVWWCADHGAEAAPPATIDPNGPSVVATV